MRANLLKVLYLSLEMGQNKLDCLSLVMCASKARNYMCGALYGAHTQRVGSWSYPKIKKNYYFKILPETNNPAYSAKPKKF
jgi:hypothetical protein